MVGHLREKVALVVGAGSVGPGWGNGKAAAVLFAREGAKVLCADVNEDAANETVQLIRQENGTANAICADVTSHDDIRRMVKACTDIYGRIDVVDYNVGLAHVGGVVELPEEEWDRIFDYATKAAMIHLTRTTAVQYAPKHIRVNTVLPGLMKTPMVEKTAGLAAEYGKGDIEAMWKVRDAQCPMGHMGDAWDVAYACLYLASDESKYVTGLELVVDGGISLKLS